MRDGECVGVTSAERSFERTPSCSPTAAFTATRDAPPLRHAASAVVEAARAASALGDGIRLAEEAGAKLVGMEAFYAHLLSADSLTRDNLCPFPFSIFLRLPG